MGRMEVEGEVEEGVGVGGQDRGVDALHYSFDGRGLHLAIK